MEKCKITFYTIDRCGYYARGNSNPEFSAIKDTLNELKTWAFQDEMTLGQTCTFSPDDYNEDIAKTYCFNLIDINQDDYLLTTWNQIPSVEGQVASVPSLEPVGEAEVSLTELPEGSIPGFATYFWFIPEREIFACVQFHNQMNGRRNLERYLREFLAKATKYVVTNAEEACVGYRKNEDDGTRMLYPQFNSFLYKKIAEIDYLRSQREQIRKIIRKDQLYFSVQQDRQWWQTMLSTLGVSEPHQPVEESLKFKFEVNHCPSEEELNEIIAAWLQESSHTKWEDTGFRLEGESQIRWLSYSLAKAEVNLDILRDNEEVVNAESLLEKLVEQKDTLLALLD